MSPNPFEWLLDLTLDALDRSRRPMWLRAPLFALVGAAWGAIAAFTVAVAVERFEDRREARTEARLPVVSVPLRPLP